MIQFNEVQLEQLNKIQIHLHGYTLKRTCYACPEQYDVFDQSGNMVAYIRLRHGSLRVDVPDCGGETIYRASPIGDGILDDSERYKYLNKCVKEIIKFYMNGPWESQMLQEHFL